MKRLALSISCLLSALIAVAPSCQSQGTGTRVDLRTQTKYAVPGGITRSGGDRLGDVVSAKDYAKGDGIADDTAGLQAAINTGRYVYVPAGNYRITGTLNFHWLKGGGFIGEKQAALATTANGTYIHWAGNSTDDVFFIQASRNLEIANITVVIDASMPANKIFHVATDATSGAPTSTNLHMRSVYIRSSSNPACGTAIAENLFDTGIHFDNSPVDGGNDLNVLEDVQIYGYHSQCILISGGGQSIGNLFTKVECIADNSAMRANPNYTLNGSGISVGTQDNPTFPVGVNSVGGHWNSIGGYFAKNSIDFMDHGSNGPATMIQGVISECGQRFFMMAQNPVNYAANVELIGNSVNINHSIHYGVNDDYVLDFEQRGSLSVRSFSIQVASYDQMPQILLKQPSSNVWNYEFAGIRYQGAATTISDIFPVNLPTEAKRIMIQSAISTYTLLPTFFGGAQTIFNCNSDTSDCSADIGLTKSTASGKYWLGFGGDPYSTIVSTWPARIGYDSGTISGQRGAVWETGGVSDPLYIRSGNVNLASFGMPDNAMHLFQKVILGNVPLSCTSQLSGTIWSDAGTLKICP